MENFTATQKAALRQILASERAGLTTMEQELVYAFVEAEIIPSELSYSACLSKDLTKYVEYTAQQVGGLITSLQEKNVLLVEDFDGRDFVYLHPASFWIVEQAVAESVAAEPRRSRPVLTRNCSDVLVNVEGHYVHASQRYEMGDTRVEIETAKKWLDITMFIDPAEKHQVSFGTLHIRVSEDGITVPGLRTYTPAEIRRALASIK